MGAIKGRVTRISAFSIEWAEIWAASYMVSLTTEAIKGGVAKISAFSIEWAEIRPTSYKVSLTTEAIKGGDRERP